MSSQIITSSLLEEEPDLIDLVDKFISRLPGMRDDILNFHAQEDWDSFLKMIHQLKGVGGNYGYPGITDICAVMEVAFKDEDYSKVTDQLTEFKNISEQILAGREENHRIAKANS
jgi:HPt (histidine-containing phosphotransfer) domain-containing protein